MQLDYDDFNNAKVYMMVPICEHEPNEIYISSTRYKYLSQSLANYKNELKHVEKGTKKESVVHALFKKYGEDNIQFILLENVECTSIDGLKARVAHYIYSMDCLNKRIPLRTNKQYIEDNKEKIKERNEEKYVCCCGDIISRGYLSKHYKTKKHIKYLKSVQLNESIESLKISSD